MMPWLAFASAIVAAWAGDGWTAAIAGPWASVAIAAWADWMLAVSLQVVPLAVVVALLDRVLRRVGPVVQSALWWMVIARLLLPPVLASPVGLVGAWPSAGAEPKVAVLAAVPMTGDAVVGGASELLARVSPPMLGEMRTVAVAFAVWLIGVVALACAARWRYRRVRRQCLEASSAAGADVVDIARAVAGRLGLRELPPIRIASETPASVAQPLVFGFFAPIVVMPASIVDRSRVEIEHVLMHELAHVRRRDPGATLACLIAQIVFWFHPAVWLARRRLATLREMACDRAVARVLGGDGTSAYRRTLILLARSAATAPAAGTIGLFQRRSALVARLELLGRPVAIKRGTERLIGVVMSLGVLVACMPRTTTVTPVSPSSAPAPAAAQEAVAASEAGEAAWPASPASLDELPGSLQKRYAVLRAMALAAEKHEPR